AVHLGLVSEAHLHRTEPPHRPTRGVVGAGADAIDCHRITAVGPHGEVAGVGEDRRGGGGVCPAVDEDLGFDAHEPAVLVGFVAIPHSSRVTMDVPGERLAPVIHHLHGPTGVEGEHAQMDVEVHVLAGTEGAADPDRV